MTEQADTFLLLTILSLVTILLVFGMKYFSALQRTRQLLANEGTYQELAARTATIQSASAAVLAQLETDIAEMKDRMTGIEKVLREVE
ncbi:hypothetical protein [Pelagibius sp. Alg239-R121]|uniref:hypothetical protein n=1 Tax=Pelagibius sp. Alg239-R121 TaxID=2993448 RepID=UPI0024A708E2|nr:hypothetical protein [Pelagibius sp. Alg239-R121]